RSNNIWITSRSSGINYANLDKRKFELPNVFIDQRIISVFESKQSAFFCSHGNAKATYFSERYAESLIIPIVLPKDKNQQTILHFIEEEQSIWAITGNYLLRWSPDRFQFEYIKNLPAYTLYLYKNPNGKIWLANFSGIFEWTNEKGEITFEPAYQFKNHQTSQATAIYEDQHQQKYLALDASKLIILDVEGNEVKKIEGIGFATAFYEEGRFLWVATTTGVLKINTHDLTVEILNEQNGGLPNETYYSIIPDEQNNFWLSSNKGIVRYDRNTKTYHRYTLADGLQGNEYNTNAFLKTQDGEIWMGGTNGLNRFYPEKIKSEIPLAKVQFTRLQINDEAAPDSINITMTEELSLAYSDNTLSFDFVGIDYSDPENVQLKYQMLGNDEDWIDAGNDGFARYSNLPFGNYTFQVKAANSDGVWSEEIKQLNIHIRRPWYRTWWFYLASVLSISGLIYGIFMYRLRQALKIERMRVKISSDLHDDVGSLLSGLAMQSELLEMTAAEERKPKLQRISELSRNAMSRMRDTVWAIDARKDKLENLLDRIREHAAETLTPNDMRFDLQVDDLALKKNMPTNIRQNLYLICKEAITNAVKHSNGNRVQIQFKKHGRNGIELTIHDNGKVVEKDHKTTGLGMSNMRLRVEQIRGQLQVDQEDGFLIRVVLG
ncbi:MAG: triple tyrosine motif-containing protein, partial [Bacteroidota bacterium]